MIYTLLFHAAFLLSALLTSAAKLDDASHIVEQTFAAFEEVNKPLVIVRGFFSSGTGWLSKLLQDNCPNDLQFHSTNGLFKVDANGLYGWKHTYFNAFERQLFEQHADHFMVILSRDAISWAFSAFAMRALAPSTSKFAEYISTRAFETYPSIPYLKHFYHAASHHHNDNNTRQRPPHLVARNVFQARRQVYSNWAEMLDSRRVKLVRYENLRANPAHALLQLLSGFSLACRNLTLDSFVHQEFRVKMAHVFHNAKKVRELGERDKVCKVLQQEPGLYLAMLSQLDLDFEWRLLGYVYPATVEEYCSYAKVEVNATRLALEQEAKRKKLAISRKRSRNSVEQAFERVAQTKLPLIVLRGLPASGLQELRSILVSACGATDVRFSHLASLLPTTTSLVDYSTVYGWAHTYFEDFELAKLDSHANHHMLVVTRDAFTWAFAGFETRALVRKAPNFAHYVTAKFAESYPASFKHYYATRRQALGPDLFAENIFQARQLLHSNLIPGSKRLHARVHHVQYETLLIKRDEVWAQDPTHPLSCAQNASSNHTFAEERAALTAMRQGVCAKLMEAPDLYGKILDALDLEYESQVLGYTYPSTMQEYCAHNSNSSTVIAAPKARRKNGLSRALFASPARIHSNQVELGNKLSPSSSNKFSLRTLQALQAIDLLLIQAVSGLLLLINLCLIFCILTRKRDGGGAGGKTQAFKI